MADRGVGAERSESPQMIASRLGLGWERPAQKALSLDDLLDLAVRAYWKRRAERTVKDVA